MALRFSCPHCQVVMDIDLEHVGQTGRCRSCGRVITIEPDQTGAAQQPNYPDPDLVPKTTGRGSAAGCCVVFLVTIAFLVVPMIVPLSAALIRTIQGSAELARRVLFGQARNLAISCIVGAASGAFLMGICATLLRNSPRLLQFVLRGAILGAMIPPGVVFVVQSLPLMIQSGVSDVAVHEQLQRHWWLALKLCAVGAVTAMLFALIVGWVLRERCATSRQ